MTSKVRLCPVADVKDGEPVGVFLEQLPALAVTTSMVTSS